MSSHLANETSSYLLQHRNNPIDWYPWCEEAFVKAKTENKPIFLSIGYSSCHWCHVMASESFTDKNIAEFLNKHFISIKVDREERPDIDSVYMSVCQAFTGSGGWPMSIFMDYSQQPFFAGTYFPKNSESNMLGFYELINIIFNKWQTENSALLKSAAQITEAIKNHEYFSNSDSFSSDDMIKTAVTQLKSTFDKINGGFGKAPKFPSSHNLIFLCNYYLNEKDEAIKEIIITTLSQMYKGGIYDHIGGGFSRYSTDERFFAPHFEKMLYDNALLIMLYCQGFEITKIPLFKEIAEKTAEFLINEFLSNEGGYFSSQDADSEGEEGKYYLFRYDETISVLGNDNGKHYNEYYDITKKGNFYGKNIPNLLKHTDLPNELYDLTARLYDYRKKRLSLDTDRKIIVSWNSLTIIAFLHLYKITKNSKFLREALSLNIFIEKNAIADNSLYAVYNKGILLKKEFIDSYAFYIWAQISLYSITFNHMFLEKALTIADAAINKFYDEQNGGFFINAKNSEQLIHNPKETYDGAMPCANSVMLYCLIRLSQIKQSEKYRNVITGQIKFLSSAAVAYPAGYCFFMNALNLQKYPYNHITCVIADESEKSIIISALPERTDLIFIHENADYKLINGKTTFYICKDKKCFPPVNTLNL